MKNSLIRLAGVTGLLVALFATLGVANPDSLDASNLFEVLSRHGALGVVTIGAGLLIITGGIDLSIGSLVGLAAMAFGVMMEQGVHPYLAAGVVLAGGAVVGLSHGLLVTVLRLQPFLVTLCGMFVYRGLAREVSPKPTGLVQVTQAHPEFTEAFRQLRFLLIGKDADGALAFPNQVLVLAVIAAVVGAFLHLSAYGRYWFAIGFNEQAARYAGVRVEVQKVIVFVLCSVLAALGGIMLLLNSGSADPSNAGSLLELYAITAAVLGGCSLKGGEGTAPGLFLGALVLPLIENLRTFLKIDSKSEPWVIGLILLAGTLVDELLRRRQRKG